MKARQHKRRIQRGWPTRSRHWVPIGFYANRRHLAALVVCGMQVGVVEGFRFYTSPLIGTDNMPMLPHMDGAIERAIRGGGR